MMYQAISVVITICGSNYCDMQLSAVLCTWFATVNDVSIVYLKQF